MPWVKWAILTVVTFTAPSAGAEPIAPKEVEGKIKWLYSYDVAKRQAKTSGKPIFVVFRCER